MSGRIFVCWIRFRSYPLIFRFLVNQTCTTRSCQACSLPSHNTLWPTHFLHLCQTTPGEASSSSLLSQSIAKINHDTLTASHWLLTAFLIQNSPGSKKQCNLHDPTTVGGVHRLGRHFINRGPKNSVSLVRILQKTCNFIPSMEHWPLLCLVYNQLIFHALVQKEDGSSTYYGH